MRNFFASGEDWFFPPIFPSKAWMLFLRRFRKTLRRVVSSPSTVMSFGMLCRVNRMCAVSKSDCKSISKVVECCCQPELFLSDRAGRKMAVRCCKFHQPFTLLTYYIQTACYFFSYRFGTAESVCASDDGSYGIYAVHGRHTRHDLLHHCWCLDGKQGYCFRSSFI